MGTIKLDIGTAQSEIRTAYLRGGPGAVVSGIVWLCSALVATTHGVPIGFAVLFFGGMLIFPVASIIVRQFFGRPNVSPSNPGGLTVIETIFPMIGGLLAAWLLIPYRPDFAFPISAIAVGAHYFGFRTAYGDWTNWILGGIMCVVGIGAIFYSLPKSNIVPYAIAVIEVSFGCWLTWVSFRNDSNSTSVRQSGKTADGRASS
ncbi:DUF7010 family protein [Pirellulaceae bacterium SH449]